jgi:hypothetical protein
MVEQENDEFHGVGQIRWNRGGAPQQAQLSHPTGVKPVFIAEAIGGAGGGHIKYSWVGNFTKAEINARLQAGQVLYEFVNNDPVRLTIMHGGSSHKSRRKRKARAGKKTKRYSIFTK